MIRAFEHHKQKPIPPGAFRIRWAKYGLAAALLVSVALWIGMFGYHRLEGMSWLDSFVNAAMILGGMGPVAELKTDGGKLFAGLYALFSGLVFLIFTSLILGPPLHRLLHRFHFDEGETSSDL